MVDLPSILVCSFGMSKSDKRGKVGSSLKEAMGLYGYMGKYKMVFIPSLVALFLTAALSLAFPYYLSDLIGGPMGTERGEIDKEALGGKINSVVITLVSILFLQAVIAYWRVRGFIKAGEGALNDIRQKVFAKMVNLPMEYFMESRSGELSARIANDLGVLRDTLLTTVPQFARMAVILIGGLVFIFVASWKLSLIMLCSIPIVVIAVAVFGRKIRGFSKNAQDALADSNVVIEETVQSIADVKSFGNEAYEKNRYETALDRFLEVTLEGGKARAAFVSFIIFVLFGTIAVVVWIGAQMLISGTIEEKDFVRFILFSIFVAASLGAFPEIMSQLQKTAGATERIRELLNEQEEEGCRGELIESGKIEFENVSFSYPSRPESKILDAISLSINAGESVALVGPSGGGKSTLFSLLLGFYQTDSGSLSFDDKSSEEIGTANIRASMAVVPQEILLFGGSILENIRYGRTDASDEEIREAAKQANAHVFIESFEEGYDTLVGPRGVKLSGGQRQRIAIARAILANPKILLLDEATSALDSESEGLVQTALEKLMEGRTSLIIAHRLSTVKDVDKILVLKDGKIVEQGTHEELLQHGGTYKLLAETQFSSL